MLGHRDLGRNRFCGGRWGSGGNRASIVARAGICPGFRRNFGGSWHCGFMGNSVRWTWIEGGGLLTGDLWGSVQEFGLEILPERPRERQTDRKHECRPEDRKRHSRSRLYARFLMTTAERKKSPLWFRRRLIGEVAMNRQGHGSELRFSCGFDSLQWEFGQFG